MSLILQELNQAINDSAAAGEDAMCLILIMVALAIRIGIMYIPFCIVSIAKSLKTIAKNSEGKADDN